MTAHLLHIGYPKTGTNHIRRWFAAHPDIAFTHGGIGGFGDVHAITASAPGLAPAWCVTSSENFVLPPPASADSESVDAWIAGRARICAHLAELFPGAHILLMTRGFAGMTLSSYSQYVRTGGAQLFADFAAFDGDWLDYAGALAAYRAAFGSERVIVLPHELLRDDPGAFFDTLAARLGVARCDAPSGRTNPSLSPIELAWYPRLATGADRLPLPGFVRRCVRKWLERSSFTNRLRRPIAWLQRRRPRPPVDAGAVPIARLRAVFAPPVALRDLPEYQPYLSDYFLA